MRLFKEFGDKLEKTMILQTWRNHNNIFVETRMKLMEICATSNLNELKENELKILRKICLHILWNILKYPKHIKYHQINKQALCDCLFERRHTLSADFEQILIDIEKELQYIGFKKENDDNWYYQYDHIQLLHLWKCYQKWINEQSIYKTRYGIPTNVCMLSNGKWEDYNILFDYEHRTMMLFDENELKIKLLQIGNPKKLSLEFNVHIQFYNDIDVNDTHAKWACLILNHTWHFRTLDVHNRDYLSNCVSVNESRNVQMSLSIVNYLLIEFNSFHVIWKDRDKITHKEPLNPYSITFKQGIQHFKDKLQMREHFLLGTDELILFECKFDKCKPEIKMNNEDILLHDIYKHLPHYPIIQVYWKIISAFMVPYKRTIDIERSDLPKNVDLDIEFIPSNQKPKFDPLPYECDLHKLKIIQDTVDANVTKNNSLQKLFHEVIKNGYVCDLITFKYTNNKKVEKQFYDNIKEQINYNEKDENGELIVDDKILTILNELKILYHDDIHKQMGYPLQLIIFVQFYCIVVNHVIANSAMIKYNLNMIYGLI
ncbi:hypothetical protein RFI_02444 [Reticulomyxa filosa]|uniref:Uncharacterized protein n=1 Tax=Reticulomyxa filosa TaxID=46433 RepID=X6P8X6_RETFI|nr:hypothetical protein RFI_02444 [Reticulomyxa filosa]|eukprot:ETO34646.1 hypothetical protein RFI_02444 [Reticulomyxa filosa]